LVAACAAHAAPVLTEGFGDVTTLGGAGWSQINNSTAGGTTGWFQGNTGVFDSASGAADSYIAANFLNAGLGGDISNWLITPVLDLSYRSVLSFATRAGGFFPDRLEVRLSTNGASGNVGATSASVGDFSTLLLAINPALGGGYPSDDWATYTMQLGFLAPGTTGRIAFRYNVTDTFSNGDYIGIDSVNVSVPEPSTIALVGIALFGFAWTLRKRTAASSSR
jgi:hypothetical protein